MPLYTVKKVSELVPATSALVKRASLEQNLPTGSRDETLISALELAYMMKIAHSTVDVEDAERVCKAVDLYGLREEVLGHTETMVKSACTRTCELKSQVAKAEQFVDHQLISMTPDFEKVAEACESLWDVHSDLVTSDAVKLYAGAGTLVKEAAVLALNHRAKRTGNLEFEKVANVIAATDISALSIDDNRAIINAIKGLEKEARYIESDIYKDIFMTKEAAIMIKLGTKLVDSTNLVRISGQAGDILGKDIGELLKNAAANKHAIEALPLGELQVLARLV